MKELASQKLNPEEIVTHLIRGSEKVDRMRKEVECLIRTIAGLIKIESLPMPRFSEHKTEQCSWRFTPVNTDDHGIVTRDLEIYCIFHFTPKNSGIVYSLKKSVPFHSKYVQHVHQCLPDFVQGVLRFFPEIQNQWEFLLRASLNI
ncbi:MAG: hypothetical protein WC819_03600 [Parcubacteria group bacterium]|jgi:hypothetical protein